ncbi:hypothetical protein BC830DRAFT_1114284 [Chytriomyces sp. MP71]|nr:hypothetical protein BC830DRAFT_1114284 [Chytriomyces sp. MP71]
MASRTVEAIASASSSRVAHSLRKKLFLALVSAVTLAHCSRVTVSEVHRLSTVWDQASHPIACFTSQIGTCTMGTAAAAATYGGGYCPGNVRTATVEKEAKT